MIDSLSKRKEVGRVPTIIITGFLGSGKTTLIKHLLNTSFKGKKVALIENEIGEISVDSLMLKTTNVEISELTSGCMCCTISGDFQNAISDILNSISPDVVLIETTGIANPLSIFLMLANDQRLILESIVAVADAANLSSHLQENLVAEIQLSICDIIILNKSDLCSLEQRNHVEITVRSFNSRAPIFHVTEGAVSPEVMMILSHNNLRADLEHFVQEQKKKYDQVIQERMLQVDTHHHHHHDRESDHYHLVVDEIETFTLALEGDFSQINFENFLVELPHPYYRAKGIIKFKEVDVSAVFNYASGRYTFDFDTLANNANNKNLLVFIGKKIANEKSMIEEKLQLCR